MATEIWVRNPVTCIRECAELLVPMIAWDRGTLHKLRIDPTKHIESHYPSAVPYRILLIGDQGSAELRPGHGFNNPAAVYPTWVYGEHTINDLERMLRRQVIPNGRTPDETGVQGQEHRVVISYAPAARTSAGTALISALSDLQFEYPDAIIHYHNTASYRVAFGVGLRSADLDPIADSKKGRIRLPNGRSVVWEQAPDYGLWCKLIGFRPADMSVLQNRTKFNIKSMQWASKNYMSEDAFRVKPLTSSEQIEFDWSSAAATMPTTKRAFPKGKKLSPGDKWLCDSCSIAKSCKLFRDGGVCAISDTETAGLARYFRTRDSDQIIDGLGRIMEKQLERAERGLESEEADPTGELNPEVTKILKSVFSDGVKLAKLVNPSLNGGTRVNIANINGATPAVGPATTNALVAGVIAEIEAMGVRRDEIDPVMVAEYLASNHRVAIEAAAHERE